MYDSFIIGIAKVASDKRGSGAQRLESLGLQKAVQIFKF